MKDKSIGYFNYALFTFLVLLLQTIVSLCLNVVFNDGKNDLFKLIFNWSVCGLIGTIYIWIFFKQIGKRFLTQFCITENITIRKWIIAICIMILKIFFSFVIFDFNFKPVLELQAFLNNFGNIGFYIFTLEYFYYSLEAFLVLIMIALIQKVSEDQFRGRNIPYGGIFCASTFAILKILIYGTNAAEYYIFTSVLFGVVYLILNKNFKFSYPITAILYIF